MGGSINIKLACEIRFYVAYELSYMCSSSSSGLESAILNFYFWLDRAVIKMGHSYSIFEDDDLFNDVSHAIGLLFEILGKNRRGW